MALSQQAALWGDIIPNNSFAEDERRVSEAWFVLCRYSVT